MSNKNNELVRELAKKIVSGDNTAKKEVTERKQSNIISVGSKQMQKKKIEKSKKSIQKVKLPPSKSKGMLTFEDESDSDHL